MAKILLSWIAKENDFIKETGVPNPDGPTMRVHQYYYTDYDYHILLTHTKSITDDTRYQHLLNLLKRSYPKHIIRPKAMALNDVIDIKEISEKINTLLLENRDHEIDIFISPGTPTMQVAWYLAHQSLALKTRLFQLRRPEHTKDKIPEQLFVHVEKSTYTASVFIQQNTMDQKKEPTSTFMVPSLQPIYDKAEKIASADPVTVLITGETGTGKERLARYIHDKSQRKHEKFIAINCSSLHNELLESRLFGYVKGSHSQAMKDTKGLFHEADGGTIFLDEIGDISPYMQQCLLRVIQEKEILRVGGVKAEPINVRIISATNKNLYGTETFREDLYYRLSVTELHLPSLIEYSVSEKEALFDFFWKHHAHKRNRNIPKLPKPLKKQLLYYRFFGNIREMENIIERIFAESDDVVTIENIPKRITYPKTEHSLLLADVEKAHIQKVYALCNSNVAKACELLGISVNTLKKKLIDYEKI